jgi:hypothetical protein
VRYPQVHSGDINGGELITMSAVEHEQHYPTFRVLYGSLPGNREFVKPLTVFIEYDDGEVIVSESLFHMHASGPTEADAIAAFRRIFSGYLDILSSQENMLSTHLHGQLQYLRSYIRSAS